MARWKTAATGGPATRAEVSGAACAAHVSRLAAAALVRAGAPQHCYRVLSALLPYWKEKTSSEYTVYHRATELMSYTETASCKLPPAGTSYRATAPYKLAAPTCRYHTEEQLHTSSRR